MEAGWRQVGGNVVVLHLHRKLGFKEMTSSCQGRQAGSKDKDGSLTKRPGNTEHLECAQHRQAPTHQAATQREGRRCGCGGFGRWVRDSQSTAPPRLQATQPSLRSSTSLATGAPSRGPPLLQPRSSSPPGGTFSSV